MSKDIEERQNHGDGTYTIIRTHINNDGSGYSVATTYKRGPFMDSTISIKREKFSAKKN